MPAPACTTFRALRVMTVEQRLVPLPEMLWATSSLSFSNKVEKTPCLIELKTIHLAFLRNDMI